MTRFIDQALPSRVIGYPVDIAPNYSTQLVEVDSGAEQANRRWLDAKREINIPDGVRDADTFQDLLDHWHVMGGPFHTFPWRDPTDFASARLVYVNQAPVLARTDQPLGTGDGVTTQFQLVKRYTVGGNNYDRPIYFPITSTVLVGVDGLDPSAVSPPLTFTVTRPGGIVEFSDPPALGAVLTAGFLFDIQVRYESDDTFRGIMRTFGVNGFADIPLREVRYCQD